MTEDLIRVRLFIVSYAPLWVIMLLKSYPRGKWHEGHQEWIFVALAVWVIISVVQSLRIIQGVKKLDHVRIFVGEVDDQGGNAAGYLATYLLPFIGVSPSTWRDWSGYVIYFVLVATIYIRTDLVLVNPTLYFFNYRVVSANRYENESGERGNLSNRSRVIIVCRRHFKFDEGLLKVNELAGGYIVQD